MSINKNFIGAASICLLLSVACAIMAELSTCDRCGLQTFSRWSFIGKICQRVACMMTPSHIFILPAIRWAPLPTFSISEPTAFLPGSFLSPANSSSPFPLLVITGPYPLPTLCFSSSHLLRFNTGGIRWLTSIFLRRQCVLWEEVHVCFVCHHIRNVQHSTEIFVEWMVGVWTSSPTEEENSFIYRRGL